MCLGFIGKLSDKVSIRITLPASLIFRAIVFYGITLIEDPGKGPAYYLVVPFIHISYYSVIIIQYSYIQKMYPKDIRGMCSSVAGISGTIGTFLYLQWTQWLY